MSLFTRLGLPGIRRSPKRPARARRRLCLQPLEDRAVPATVISQLTDSTGGFFGAPSISADGTRIAFQSTLDLVPGENTDGNLELFVYNATTGAFTQVTSTTGTFFGAGTPAISADGNWVVFTSTQDLVAGFNTDGNAEVFLYSVSGNSLTQVTDTAAGFFADQDNQSPSISGDGTRIAFVSTRDLVAGGNTDGSAELFLYDVPTDSFTQVTDTAGFIFSVQGTAISADGNRVAFLSDQDLVPAVGNADGGLDYFVYDVGTASFTQLTATAPGGSYSLPKIDADGSRVAFSTSHDLTGFNSDFNQEVFLWDAGTGLSQVTDTTDPSQSSLATAISADGSRLAVSSNADLAGGNADLNLEVFLYGVTTNTFTQVTDTVNPPEGEVGSDLAALSADGTRIALISNADLTGTGTNTDGSYELFLATANGVKPPTPGERIAELIASVEALVQAGKLTSSQAAGLLDKLRSASRNLEMGRTAKAVHMLELFKKQVQGLVKDGALSAADGGSLVADAQVIIDELN